MKTQTGILSMAILLALSQVFCHADIIVTSQADARLFTGNTLASGGNTISGRLIGLNTAGVDNVLLQDFSDLSAVAGQTVTGATISVGIAVGFANGNHGTTDDIIALNEIAIGNAGWMPGTTAVTSGDEQNGAASWDFQSTFADGTNGTSVQWVDANGASVANILGAFTQVAQTSGYNQGTGGNPPLNGFLTFTVDAATAQSWVDNGLGGLALSTIDNGDSRSRFNFQGNGTFTIDFNTVPEPTAGLVCSLAVVMAAARRRRK